MDFSRVKKTTNHIGIQRCGEQVSNGYASQETARCAIRRCRKMLMRHRFFV
jgi:hypothetical protein